MAKYLDSVGLNRLMEIIKAALNTKAPLASPALTGNPTAPTQSTSDDSTKLATTEFVHDVIDGLSTGVTGVKGDAESTYRTGQVNLTPANLGIADFVGSRFGGQAGTHGLVPAPPAKTGDQIGNKYFLLDDGYWHGGWMDLYFDSSEDEYVLRIRYMQSDGQTQTTLWSCVIPAVTTTTRGMMRATDKSNLDTLWNSGDYQSDWNQSDSTAADYIKNKPTLPGDFTGATSSAAGAHGLVPAPVAGEDDSILWGDGDWEELAIGVQAYANSVDVELHHGAGTMYDSVGILAATSSLAGVMSATDKSNLDALVEAGPEANVQSDWNQTTTTADDYIKNKPSLGTAAAKTVGAASGNLQENGAALSASKAVVTDANKKFVSSSYSLGSACAKTVGASSGNLQENGAALSASKAVVTDANKKFVSSSYTLGAACEKSIGSVTDGDTGLVTGDAVYDAIQSSIAGIVGNLVYKGAVSAASGMTNFKKGWSWIADTEFTIGSGSSAKSVEVGDMLIANADGASATTSNIDVIQTNIDTLTTGEVETLWANAVPTA